MAGIKRNIKLILELMKFRIALLSTLSTMVGYIVAADTLTSRILAPTLGIFVLAGGALALNHIQERDIDARMPRTAARPLPAGRVSVRMATIIATALILSGLGVLLIWCGLVACALGAFNLFWYNGVYTPLKKRSAFAVVPGSLVGAVPPMVGWLAAGKSIEDPAIIAIAFFFFIWQIPHFWLLLHKLGHQYELAELRSLSQVFSEEQVIRITFSWIIATAVTCLMLPAFGSIHYPLTVVGLLFSALWLIARSVRLLRLDADNSAFRSTFLSINTYAMVVMLLIAADKIVTIY